VDFGIPICPETSKPLGSIQRVIRPAGKGGTGDLH